MAETPVIEEIFDYYSKLKDKQSQENIVSMLREIQEAEGFISPEMKVRAANALDVKEAVLTVILKMYSDLKTADYKHTVTVCKGPRCSAKNAGIYEACLRVLKPDKNGISSDGRIRLCTSGCLKLCKSSPNILVDGKAMTGVDAKSIPALIKSLQKC